MSTSRSIVGPKGNIEINVSGDGPLVVLLPSLGRGAEDFADLRERLGSAGYCAVAPEPRGIGGSDGELAGLTMTDLAADVAAVIAHFGSAPATLVGHAFGNRVARMTATEHPALVDSVVLLACGGQVQPERHIHEALIEIFDPTKSGEERLRLVDLAFFAPGNDATVWIDGWHGGVAAAQGAATRDQPVDHWWGAGGKSMLVVQPIDDVLAPAGNAQMIIDDFGDRATLVEIADAGHALLPEQPAAVADAILTFLRP